MAKKESCMCGLEKILNKRERNGGEKVVGGGNTLKAASKTIVCQKPRSQNLLKISGQLGKKGIPWEGPKPGAGFGRRIPGHRVGCKHVNSKQGNLKKNGGKHTLGVTADSGGEHHR